jgi:hypothetical protein
MLKEQFIGWRALKESCEDRWAALTAHLISSNLEMDPWKSYYGPGVLPTQGWKIHISALVFNACEIFECAHTILEDEGISYKTVGSLNTLRSLNAGIQYGYSQIGKFITIYPTSTSEFRRVITKLSEVLAKFRGPTIPFDFQYHGSDCIFFRYGAFRSVKKTDSTDNRYSKNLVGAPNGRQQRDRGRTTKWCPKWEKLPVPAAEGVSQSFEPYGVIPYLTLAKSGKGAVYKCADFSVPTSPITRVLKQGLRLGAADWSQADGASRLNNEIEISQHISNVGVNTPPFIRSFDTNLAVYAVFEYINGTTLDIWLKRYRPNRKRRRAVSKDIAKNLTVLHQAGIAWRDMKLTNILVESKTQMVFFLDFEGACRNGERLPDCWGSPSFIPPEFGTEGANGFEQDIFAFGRVLEKLLTLDQERDHIKNLVASAAASAGNRPCAQEIFAILNSA